MKIPHDLSFARNEFPDDFLRVVQRYLEAASKQIGLNFVVGPDIISVNGDSVEDMCETFVLPTWKSILDIPGNDYVLSKEGDIRLYTKTNRQPYDKVVCGVMVLARLWWWDDQNHENNITLWSDDDDEMDDAMYFISDRTPRGTPVCDIISGSVSNYFRRITCDDLSDAIVSSCASASTPVARLREVRVLHRLLSGMATVELPLPMSAFSLRYSCIRCFDHKASVRIHLSVREAVDMWIAHTKKNTREGSAESAKGLEAYVAAIRDAYWVIYRVFTEWKFHPSRIDWVQALSQASNEDDV